MRSAKKRGDTDIEAKELAHAIAEAALDKKAEEIVIMDMRPLSNIADYFVIMSASSAKRVETISLWIDETLSKKGIRRWHIEGLKESLWVLLDYGDVIAHVFYRETREFYNLERLWRDAPRERFILSRKATPVKTRMNRFPDQNSASGPKPEVKKRSI